MTMMMMSSQFGLEDMEALLWGPSSPMADPMGSLLHPDEEEVASIEGGASPLSSSSSSSSPLPHLSPPPSPPSLLFQGDKAEAEDLLSLPWLSVDELGHSHIGADDGKEDAFSGMDWMAERVDLSEFDLDSLIGSCSPDESPSSPEDLIASLECHMELDSLPLPTLPTPGDLMLLPVPTTESLLPTLPDDQPQEVHSPPLCVPEPQEELEIKSEPVSPAPSPSILPTFTLDLGSEVDVSECEYKPLVPAEVAQVPRIVLSLSPTRIVLLLSPKEEVAVATTVTIPDIHSDSDSGINSTSCTSPSTTSSRSPRSRPYPTPKSSKPNPESPTSGKMKSSLGGGAPPKEKKLKKMEQNKTAATRYRQKKRVEQDALAEECAELEQRNHVLEEKADSIAKEIQYLKDLMEEVRQAKSKKSLGV